MKGLRGIREGKLTDLSPLVVLVGPNGSGKSTVIEGILIGASPTAEAMLQVVRRHEAGGSGPRWLLWRAGERGATEISVKTDGLASPRRCKLELDRSRPDDSTLITVRVIEQGYGV